MERKNRRTLLHTTSGCLLAHGITGLGAATTIQAAAGNMRLGAITCIGPQNPADAAVAYARENE